MLAATIYRRPPLAAWAAMLLLFAVAMVVAHVLAEFTDNRDVNRTVYSMIVAAALATVALCVDAVRPTTNAGRNAWLLLWTFSYVAFLIHLYWAVFGVFQGQFSRIWTDVDTPILSPTLTVWWGVDVVLAWVFVTPPRWVRIQRTLVSLLLFVLLIGSTMRPRSIVPWMGTILIVTVPVCFLIGLARTASIRSWIVTRGFAALNHFVPWHRLPGFFGALNLFAYREILREQNLHGTDSLPGPNYPPPAPPLKPENLIGRTSDGEHNDLSAPAMGMAGMRFGRNFPLDRVHAAPLPALMQPSPRTVSNELLARRQFMPATSLNLLAAAWIQFMTHDWFFHGEDPNPDNRFTVPLEPGDPWPHKPMLVTKTQPDLSRPGATDPPTFVNQESHWWDGSQIYGSDDATQMKVRTRNGDGKLRLTESNLLEIDPAGLPLTGFNENWWIGLTLLHTLFAAEHNAICAHLRTHYPQWDDDQMFHTARLINVALMAKIHTVEWTPAILNHPALQIGMNANWWGALTERITRVFGRLSDSEAISGIPGSPCDHNGVPFALTEEFVSVYRLHALMPDEFTLHALEDGRVLKTFQLPNIIVGATAQQEALKFGTLDDYLYSCGICHPGAVRLGNYPSFLRQLQRATGLVVDLGAVDILRDRERGVPRYNDFRELVHKPRVHSYEEVSKEWAPLLEKVYGPNGIDQVDLMVGLYAEEPPEGFGFSDTAFRIFILMASRRLKSDRFFTTDYTKGMYTEAGMDWIDNNDMRSILVRHYPRLKPVLRQIDNAFRPWNSIAPAAQSAVGRAASSQEA